jgi:hypothetical protein
MKLLFVDLLGRDTLEAKVFKRTVDKEFKRVNVVSTALNSSVILYLVGLNVYFFYGSLAYSSDKSRQWQLSWLHALLTNLAIEILFNSLLEAFLLDYLVPISIADSTAVLKEKLKGLVSKVAVRYTSNEVSDEQEFSAPQYFFVSMNIARRRLDIPESSLILSYTDPTPTDICKKFKLMQAKEDERRRKLEDMYNESDLGLLPQALIILTKIAESILKAAVIGLMSLGTLPDAIQQLVVRLFQPLFLAVFAYFGVNHPLFIILIGAVLFMTVYCMSRNNDSKKVKPIIIDKDGKIKFILPKQIGRAHV